MGKKILNDPVYGFIDIPTGISYNIIEHKYFQRLRRIRQLGFSDYVYPGAIHSRFQHTLGAVHLMNLAIESLRSKGHKITSEEQQGASLAILLHDIGHSPFSHTLERIFTPDHNHEDLSLAFMKVLNQEFNGELELGIEIFLNKYHKKFLHQLVSSQLDVDRLDYLKRDSFHTGVSEGVIGSDRIIKMLNLANGELVVEAKGIYSIEKFLMARWLMYWQVYLHKTVVAADQLLIKVFQRVKLLQESEDLFATDTFAKLFKNTSFRSEEELVDAFSMIDDSDIITHLKIWSTSKDRILVRLAQSLLNRNLFKIEIQNEPFDDERLNNLRTEFKTKSKLSDEEAEYFIFTGSISNNAYSPSDEKINILFKDGSVSDIADASDMLDLSNLTKVVKKYFLCYPKDSFDYNF